MFKFTIRELLLLMLVVALGIGWALDHVRLARMADFSDRQARFARNVIKRFGWKVTDDFEVFPAEKDAVWPRH